MTYTFEPSASEIRWTVLAYRLFPGSFHEKYAQSLGLQGNERVLD